MPVWCASICTRRRSPAEKLIRAICMHRTSLGSSGRAQHHCVPRSAQLSSSAFPNAMSTNHPSNVFPKVKQQTTLPASNVCCPNGTWRAARPLTVDLGLSLEGPPPGRPDRQPPNPRKGTLLSIYYVPVLSFKIHELNSRKASKLPLPPKSNSWKMCGIQHWVSDIRAPFSFY